MPTGFKVLMGGAAVLVLVFVGWTIANPPGDAVDNLPMSQSPSVPVAKAPPSGGTLANDVTRSPGATPPRGTQPPTGGAIRDIDTESRNRPTLGTPNPQPQPAQTPIREQTPPLPPVVRPANAPSNGSLTAEPPPVSSPGGMTGGSTTPGATDSAQPGRLNQPGAEPRRLDGTGPTASPAQPAPQGETASPAPGNATLPPIRVPEPQPNSTADPERPGRNTPGPGPTLTDPASEHVVAEGDRLIDIADQHYSDGNLWTAIKLANPGLDENRLFVGKKLKIPSKAEAQRLIADSRGGAPRPAASDARSAAPGETAKPEVKPVATTPPAAGEKTYVVGEGDSLIKIARVVLKDENRWREIFELNKDKLEKPDRLLVGMKLRLPEK